MRYAPMIDATGFQSLKEIIKTFQADGILLILSGIRVDLRKSFRKNGIYEIIERKYIVSDIKIATSKAEKYLKENT
jgi:SulP family sulfate permease